MQDKTTDENGTETVVDLSGEVAETDTQDDRPDGPDGQQAEGQNGPNGAPVAASDRNKRGQFVPGNVGGPGRGHFTDYSEAAGNGAEGGASGDLAGQIAAMVADITAAVSRKGPAYWNKEAKDHPAVMLQTWMALMKLQAALPGGTPGGGEVKVVLGDNLTGIAAGMMEHPAIEGDEANMDVDAARQEVRRLRAENVAQQRTINGLPPRMSRDDRPLVDAPAKEASECYDCREITKALGRMIEPHSACRYCGQTWDDNTARPVKLTRNRPRTDDDAADRRRASANGFVVTAGGGGGWATVDTSQGIASGIKDALEGGGKGLFGR
ncbi:MAG TPA: hypothetical protein VM219_04850 [Phycisphaerae bacterium]|nr:hypothetical protein [Phycisphaerae bacterium]